MSQAVEFINQSVGEALKGKDLANMNDFDDKLSTLCQDKQNVEMANTSDSRISLLQYRMQH